MGHRYHVRVVVNGHFAYNLGGKTRKRLEEVMKDHSWDPMQPRDELTLGMWHKSPLALHPRIVPDKIKSVTLFFITRCGNGRGTSRKVTEIHQYWYSFGKLNETIHHGPLNPQVKTMDGWEDCPFYRGQPAYDHIINKIDMRYDNWGTLTPRNQTSL